MDILNGYFTAESGHNATFKVVKGEKYESDVMHDPHTNEPKSVPSWFTHYEDSYRFVISGKSNDIDAIAPMFHRQVGFAGRDVYTFSIQIKKEAYDNFVKNVLGKPVNEWEINPYDVVGRPIGHVLIILGRWTTGPIGSECSWWKTQ